jgi:hypothetical protein
MSRLVIVSTSTSNNTAGGAIIPLDIHRGAFNVGVGIVKVSGAPTTNVEITFQNPLENGAVPANFTWYPITALTSVSTTVFGAITTPCHALRVRQADTGDARVFVIQSGLVNN